jgi:hypothetical protein
MVISRTLVSISAVTNYTIRVTDGVGNSDSATVSLTVNSPVTASQAIVSKRIGVNTNPGPFTPVNGSG